MFDDRWPAALSVPDVVHVDVHGGSPAVRDAGRSVRGGTVTCSLVLRRRLW